MAAAIREFSEETGSRCRRSARYWSGWANGYSSSVNSRRWRNLVKLAANVLTATTLECMGEVLALLRKGGVDRHLAYDVLTNSLFESRVHKIYGGKIVDERYSPPGMAAPLAIKDLRLALAEAERAAVPMPAASLVHDRLIGIVARGWADLDWSALGICGLLAPTAGTVEVGGFNAASQQAHQLLGYVPDQPYLYDKLTGREFLRFVVEMYGLEPWRRPGSTSWSRYSIWMTLLMSCVRAIRRE